MSSRPSSTSHSYPVAPTVPSALHILASPTPSLLDASLPTYLLPQVVRLLRESAEHVVRRRIAHEEELRAEGLIPTSGGKGKGRAEGDVREMIDKEAADRVERIGLMVGGYIAEKLMVARLPLASHLDIIKFICKDLFLFVYSKQIDNLRTNHRGVFVLQSHAFPPLTSLSSHRGPAADLEAAKAHLIFPQALVQGALGRLGMAALVTAESSNLPQCTFQIRTVKSTQQAPTPSTGGTPAGGTPQPGGTHGQSGAGAGHRPPALGIGAAQTGLGVSGHETGSVPR